MNNDSVMLTVKILAFNHEKYLAKTIESILSQKTCYNYEILIGEDCSTDRTKEIAQFYAKTYPSKVRLICHKKNMGCTKNAYSLDIHARGKYLAGCEGDDFWCDDMRIQKDIVFLESHPQYAGISHRCKVVDEKSIPISEDKIEDRIAFWRFEKEIFTINDFEQWKMPGHGMTLTTRNVFLKRKIDYSIVYKASKRVADRTHLLICLLEGKIYCMDDVVGCYRYCVSNKLKNHMSLQQQYNLRAEDYIMIRKLEYWADATMGTKLNMEYIKKERLVGCIVFLLKNPTWTNLDVLLKIINNSGERVKYLYYTTKTVFIKLFNWHVLHSDKRIKL